MRAPHAGRGVAGPAAFFSGLRWSLLVFLVAAAAKDEGAGPRLAMSVRLRGRQHQGSEIVAQSVYSPFSD